MNKQLDLKKSKIVFSWKEFFEVMKDAKAGETIWFVEAPSFPDSRFLKQLSRIDLAISLHEQEVIRLKRLKLQILEDLRKER